MKTLIIFYIYKKKEMKDWFNRNSTHFIIAALFVALCFIYFNPAFLGKSLGQNDVTRAQSTQTEINEYKERGETILWTNQIHAGMPTFQIWAQYPNNITTWIVYGINYTFPKPSGTVLLLLDLRAKELGKNVLSIQILWTVILSVLMIASPFIQLALTSKIPLLIIFLLLLFGINIIIIVRNAISLNQKKELAISLVPTFLIILNPLPTIA